MYCFCAALRLLKGKLKDHAIDFTHNNQFHHQKEYYSACKNMSSLAMEKFFQVWENNSGDVIKILSNWAWDFKFITESQQYDLWVFVIV